MSSNQIAGIDEAGRGAVIGPLVICCAYCSRSSEKRLQEFSKDSKQLSPEMRELTYKALKDFCKFKWVEISAADLSKYMGEMSLNDIEAMFMASMAKSLVNADVMIDMPDRYSWTFRKRMEKYELKRFEAEHKADENYPIVAAASICAKVLRDHKIEQIKKEIGIDFGSGYPGDEKTRAALKNKEYMKKLKPFIRHRWKTLETIKQRKLFEEE